MYKLQLTHIYRLIDRSSEAFGIIIHKMRVCEDRQTDRRTDKQTDI